MRQTCKRMPDYRGHMLGASNCCNHAAVLMLRRLAADHLQGPLLSAAKYARARCSAVSPAKTVTKAAPSRLSPSFSAPHYSINCRFGRPPQMRDYGSTSGNLSMVMATLCLEREAMQINAIQSRTRSDEGQIFNTAITLAVLALMCALVWLLAIGG